jgi:energy-converting hydrogenase Eha subunit C
MEQSALSHQLSANTKVIVLKLVHRAVVGAVVVAADVQVAVAAAVVFPSRTT